LVLHFCTHDETISAPAFIETVDAVERICAAFAGETASGGIASLPLARSAACAPGTGAMIARHAHSSVLIADYI
jgi:hypothetical protein